MITPRLLSPDALTSKHFRADSVRLPRLAVPLIIASLASTGLGLVNAVQVAPLGAEALAAVGFGAMLVALLQTIGLGLFAGGRIAIAQAVGASDLQRARALGRGMVALGLLLALLGLALIPLSHPIFELLGVPAAIAPGAEDYTAVRLLGAPALLSFDAAVNVLQGTGDALATRRTMRAMVVLGGVTMATAPLFIDVAGLGLAGAAWAANAGIVAGLASLVPSLRPAIAGGGAPRRATWSKVLTLGLPLAGLNAADVMSALALQALLAHLGEVELAAHVLVLRLTSVASLPAYAIGDALSVVVGCVAGARRHDLIRPFTKTALRLATAFVGVTTLTFLSASEALASASGATPDVARVASNLLVVAAAFQVVEGAVAIGLGALAGLGETRFMLLATLVSAWLVKLPVTAALTHNGFGIDAAWWAAGIEMLVLGALVVHRLARALGGAPRLVRQESVA